MLPCHPAHNIQAAARRRLSLKEKRGLMAGLAAKARDKLGRLRLGRARQVQGELKAVKEAQGEGNLPQGPGWGRGPAWEVGQEWAPEAGEARVAAVLEVAAGGNAQRWATEGQN